MVTLKTLVIWIPTYNGSQIVNGETFPGNSLWMMQGVRTGLQTVYKILMVVTLKLQEYLQLIYVRGCKH